MCGNNLLIGVDAFLLFSAVLEPAGAGTSGFSGAQKLQAQVLGVLRATTALHLPSYSGVEEPSPVSLGSCQGKCIT